MGGCKDYDDYDDYGFDLLRISKHVGYISTRPIRAYCIGMLDVCNSYNRDFVLENDISNMESAITDKEILARSYPSYYTDGSLRAIAVMVEESIMELLQEIKTCLHGIAVREAEIELMTDTFYTDIL